MKGIIVIITALVMFPYIACADESANYPYLTLNSYVRDMVNHPAFRGFGERMLPRDNNTALYDTRLSNDTGRLPYSRNGTPAVLVEALNRLSDGVGNGGTIFREIYTPQEKQRDRAKENTGLFFFKGNPGAPFAVVCPGGAWAMVSSLNEGFPVAWEINKQGYNVFVIRYRIGGEQIACEDLAAAIAFIFDNARTLGVSAENYSLWGFSAGARMAARLSSHGTRAYGQREYPKPVAAVIAYTAHSDYTPNDPPTYTIAGERDGIAPPATMERRVNAMRAAGVTVEFRVFPNAPHGFGLGIGTSADGWINNAVRFWERYMGSGAR
jgi:acetyl esterase/lipase